MKISDKVKCRIVDRCFKRLQNYQKGAIVFEEDLCFELGKYLIDLLDDAAKGKSLA